MDFGELGKIGDYQTYCDKDATITSECWELVEKKLNEISKGNKISVLRGLFEDQLITIGIKEPIGSTIKWLNYVSRFKSTILITKRSEEEYRRNKLQQSVKVNSIAKIVANIEDDDNFTTWKSIELLRMQKMIPQEMKEKAENEKNKTVKIE